MKIVKQVSSFFENVFFKKKKAREGVAQDAAKFTLGFALSASAAYFILYLTGNLLSEIAARCSEMVGKSFVEQITYASTEGFPHLQGIANGVAFDAEISELCSGKLELAVMAGLLLASRDKPLAERMKGIALGAFLLLAFNPFRIALTLASVGTPYLAIVHDALFRVSLVILLVVFYAFWYYWNASRPASKPAKS